MIIEHHRVNWQTVMSVIWSGCRCVYKRWQSFHSQQLQEVLLCWHYIYIQQVTSREYPAFAYTAIRAHSHVHKLSCSKSSSFDRSHPDVLRSIKIIKQYTSNTSLLYLYRARNKVTQLSIPTHAQLQCH